MKVVKKVIGDEIIVSNHPTQFKKTFLCYTTLCFYQFSLLN